MLQASWAWGPEGHGAILLVSCDKEFPFIPPSDCDSEPLFNREGNAPQNPLPPKSPSSPLCDLSREGPSPGASCSPPAAEQASHMGISVELTPHQLTGGRQGMAELPGMLRTGERSAGRGARPAARNPPTRSWKTQPTRSRARRRPEVTGWAGSREGKGKGHLGHEEQALVCQAGNEGRAGF